MLGQFVYAPPLFSGLNTEPPAALLLKLGWPSACSLLDSSASSSAAHKYHMAVSNLFPCSNLTRHTDHFYKASHHSMLLKEGDYDGGPLHNNCY